ncbi:tyrosine phospatase-like protein [Leishmania major strain Friedlin]|uniref:Tyrosine phospatase-like protein n=1 Tax=Leishmania major TaxID=5664 RepID=Q9U0Z9_LEIMA|nr:tyrosine phospatase-like protein [Leishmania major strain Friedlin]CAC22628.1 tyrosine phospatase-like protein [Leishmania major strain Friedlin]CAG9567779.1 tyrosine_phospatase-like_protein [Leishmania major strain Friedlin]|eukprot:XP_888595.1 tyrosine phospatase-like protein [Leishmania major strain Friedlin]
MSAPPSQPHSMWVRRGHSTHDAAAALFEEMSHAARTGGGAGALPTSLLTAAPRSHVQHLRGSRCGGTAADASLSQPSYSTGLSPAATTTTTVTSPSGGHTSLPLALPNPLPTPSAATPYFYVHRLGSRRSAVGQYHVNCHSRGGSDPAAAPHAWGVPPSSPTYPPPPSRSNLFPGLVSAATAGAPMDIENGAGHNSPGSLSTSSQSLTASTGLGGGAGSGAVGGSHLTTPPTTRGTPAAAAAATPVAAPVYVWHSSSSMAGAAPWLRLHRPANAAAACVGGRRGSAAPAAGTSGRTGGVWTPQNPGSSGVGTLASPPHPTYSLTLLEHAHLSTVFGAADEDAAQRSSTGGLSGRDTGGGVPAMTRGLSQPHHQQELHADPVAGSGASGSLSAALPLTLVPPFRFARVESGVYRGAYPVLRNFPYIRRLRLRTMVSLIPEPPTYDLKCFAEAEHIQLHHIHAERAKGEVQLLPSELSEALQLIMNKDMHPLYIHCLDGRHVTGLVIMALRKLLQWDANVANAEFQRFTREVQDEAAFIADYTGPLLVPPHLPAWLWGGSIYDAATGQQKRLPTTIRLRLSTAVSGGAGSAAATAGGVAAAPGAGLGCVSASASGGASSVTGTGPVNGPLSAASVAVGHKPKGTMRGPSGDLRSQAAAPWMCVPQAETVAADGQHYIDVDRLPVAPPLRGSLPGAAAPQWIPSAEPSAAASTGTVSGSGSGTGTLNVHLQLTRSSAHSSRSTSEKSNMAGLPAVVSAAAAASSTGGVGGDSRWQSTVSWDALQQHQRRLASSLIHRNAAPSKGPGASGLLDGRVSALLWTPGLIVPSATVGGGSGIPGSGRVSGGSAGSSGGGGGAAGGNANGGGGAVVGVNGPPTGSSQPPSARTPKRSYSR